MSSTTRTSWTEELIEGQLRTIATTLGRFPSAMDMRRMGRNDLCCAVTKAGGLLAWSARLGIPRQHSDSDTGWDGERAFVEACQVAGLAAVRSPNVKAPFDVLVEGVLRVDVKAAKFATYTSGGKSHSGWWYRIGKMPQADLVVMWQLDTGNFYGVPWLNCPTSNVAVSESGGKYIPYLNNWPLIRELIATRKREREQLVA